MVRARNGPHRVRVARSVSLWRVKSHSVVPRLPEVGRTVGNVEPDSGDGRRCGEGDRTTKAG